MPPPAADFVRDLLRRADAGLVFAQIGVPWRYFGYPSFLLLAGRVEIVIFDDAGSWDYIERVIFHDGSKAVYEYDAMPSWVRNFRPRGELAHVYAAQMTLAEQPPTTTKSISSARWLG